MKYCYRGGNLLSSDGFDEVILEKIKYEDFKTVEDITESCKPFEDKKIIFSIPNFNECINNNFLSLILNYCKESKNAEIRFGGITTNQEEIDIVLKVMKDYPEVSFFFQHYVDNWDTLIYFIQCGVKQVYITQELGFDIARVAEVCHEQNVLIRVFPNVAQSQWDAIDDLRKFWIRPEDIDLYEGYIDTIEFYGETERQAVYLDIYKKDKQWAGNLQEIIIGLNTEINSYYLLPRFGEYRIKCNKNCWKTNKCHICDRIIELSKNLEENKIRLIEKEEEQKNG